MNKGQKLYLKAKKIIPGGVQLLSKRPEIYLPDKWPSYYKSAKGCNIQTLDGKNLLDFSNCSVGMCPLGYANKFVNNEVQKNIRNGNICTLNSPYEIELAKKMISLHPWSSQVKYTKSGGEAVSVAIRIARAYSKKEKILFCGYHGWHDWYIAANKNSSNLDQHLLPGVSSNGVPNSLKNTVIPFEYNNESDFNKKFFKNLKNLACVIMEPTRSVPPNENFIQNIKKFCKKNNIILIFDEITTGWRECLGGVHLKYNVSPDFSIFSKGTSNGFPLGIILGNDKLKAAETSFISSAYWTESMGFVAALKTIEYMEKNSVQKKLIKKGRLIKKIWKDASEKYKVPIEINGLDALANFSFRTKHRNHVMTYFTEQMLKFNILANGNFFPMISHKKNYIDSYKIAFEKTMRKIKKNFCNSKPKLNLVKKVKHFKFRNRDN